MILPKAERCARDGQHGAAAPEILVKGETRACWFFCKDAPESPIGHALRRPKNAHAFIEREAERNDDESQKDDFFFKGGVKLSGGSACGHPGEAPEDERRPYPKNDRGFRPLKEKPDVKKRGVKAAALQVGIQIPVKIIREFIQRRYAVLGTQSIRRVA